MDQLSDEEFFMSVALLSARRSKDPVTQVGACIVNADGEVVSTGYNGMPIGFDDAVAPWGKDDSRGPDTKYPYVCHAEENAVINAVCPSLKGCTMYVTLFPCIRCALFVVQSKIAKVNYLNAKEHKPETNTSRDILRLAGVAVEHWSGRRGEFILSFNLPCEWR